MRIPAASTFSAISCGENASIRTSIVIVSPISDYKDGFLTECGDINPPAANRLGGNLQNPLLNVSFLNGEYAGCQRRPGVKIDMERLLMMTINEGRGGRLAPRSLTLEQSQYLAGLEVQVHIIEDRAGRQPRHGAHLAQQRVQEACADRGADIADRECGSPWAHPCRLGSWLKLRWVLAMHSGSLSKPKLGIELDLFFGLGRNNPPHPRHRSPCRRSRSFP